MTAAIATVISEVHDFLVKNSREPHRPVPIAQAIGEKDIRRVRAALRDLCDAGEAVSCTVIVNGEKDEEYRAAASGGSIRWNNVPLANREAATRPPDASTGLPSRMTDLPKEERPQATKQVVIEVPTFVEVATSRPTYRRLAPRRLAIIECITTLDRAVTSRDVCDFFAARGEELTITGISSCIGDMAAAKLLVEVGKIYSANGKGWPMRAYATPAIAERVARIEQAAEPAATPPSEPAAPAAPVVTEPLFAKAPHVRVQDTPKAPQSDARTNLEVFFKGCDGNWYGLPWLVRMAGGDVPATLEALAAWQRQKRLAYSEADRAPIWRAVEGRW